MHIREETYYIPYHENRMLFLKTNRWPGNKPYLIPYRDATCHRQFNWISLGSFHQIRPRCFRAPVDPSPTEGRENCTKWPLQRPHVGERWRGDMGYIYWSVMMQSWAVFIKWYTLNVICIIRFISPPNQCIIEAKYFYNIITIHIMNILRTDYGVFLVSIVFRFVEFYITDIRLPISSSSPWKFKIVIILHTYATLIFIWRVRHPETGLLTYKI